LGVTAIKPVERHGWEAVKWFFYDKNTGAIMGRTCKSWALISAFYLVYYTCLIIFWALMLIVFFQTLDYKTPRWTESSSLIGRSPALGVRPGQTDKLLDSSIILYNQGVKEDRDGKLPGWGGWQNRTQTFLDKHYNDTLGVNCASKKVAPKDKFCRFSPKRILRKCGRGNFGYDEGKPCILLKLNKIFGLIPDYINDTANLPKEVPSIPKNLELHINSVPKGRRNQVWVDCKGERPADIEALGPNDITYYPTDRGFPGKYFPYTNVENYQSPLVAVRFENPPIGQLLHVECRAWAGNIIYDDMDRLGKAHFELMIHSSDTAELVEKEL